MPLNDHYYIGIVLYKLSNTLAIYIYYAIYTLQYYSFEDITKYMHIKIYAETFIFSQYICKNNSLKAAFISKPCGAKMLCHW
jgi:hypothetical protein